MSDKGHYSHGAIEQPRDATLAVHRIGPKMISEQASFASLADFRGWSLVTVNHSDEFAEWLAAASVSVMRNLDEGEADEPTIIRPKPS